MLARVLDWLDERAVRKHREKTLGKIAEHGWTATYVGEQSHDQVEFAYTVGFSDFGAPELIVFSLHPLLINVVFWEYFDAMRQGTPLKDGLILRPDDPDMEGFECMLRSAVKTEAWDKHVFDAIHYSRSKGRLERPPVMQIVWPSKQTGDYPWSPGCPATVIESQPALYEIAPPDNIAVIDASC